MALGGILAAVAVVIMNLVGLIPVNTYVVPVLCMVLLQLVLKNCGKRVAWAWYAAVSILGLLMCPDKEAAAVFAALGYYPILKPWLDRRKCKWLWKGLLFNTVILSLYWLLMHVMGMTELAEDMQGINREQQLLTYGVLACLKGLQEKGCNGPVTEAIHKIEQYLNAKAHEA